MDEIRSIVGGDHRLTPPEVEPPEQGMAEMELAALRPSVKRDYEALCRALLLEPCPLDIYSPSSISDAVTEFGTPVKNFTPGYNSQCIILPMISGVSSRLDAPDLPFPPSEWDPASNEWPEWRLTLWHETLHQVEHDIHHSWDGTNQQHRDAYHAAIDYAAGKLAFHLATSHKQLQRLVLHR